jgi:hypothetical protein
VEPQTNITISAIDITGPAWDEIPTQDRIVKRPRKMQVMGKVPSRGHSQIEKGYQHEQRAGKKYKKQSNTGR